MRFRMAALVVALLACSSFVFATDITLVKHARKAQAPLSTQHYIVMEGDTLRNVLTREYGAREKDLPALFKRFRQENPGIQDLDIIHAGSKISIPSKGPNSTRAAIRKKTGDMQVKRVSPDIYMVKQGQHLAQILREVYGIPEDLIFHEYMALIKEMNPEISDPNQLIPGQKIRVPGMQEVLAAARKAQNGTGQPVVATTAGTAPLKVGPPVTTQSGAPAVAAKPSSPVVRERNEAKALASQGNTTPPAKGNAAESGGKAQAAQFTRRVKSSVLPTLERMGGRQSAKGTYFMPLAGGASISINTNEIPVMELDTGRKIIFDAKGTITPEMKEYIEKAFPSFTVIAGDPAGLEGLMDKVLSVSGYFSINRDPGPLLVGEEEKVRFFGKWIVYKDFSRRNVFVINILKDSDSKTPAPIRSYAKRFGIDLIEVGGSNAGKGHVRTGSLIDLKHSSRKLLDRLGVAYEADKEIELVSGKAVRIAYKAPLIVGKKILTENMPDQETAAVLVKQSYVLINTRTEPVDGVLKAIGLKVDGPPVKIAVAPGRTELEIPAMHTGNRLILKNPIDPGIARYIASTGMDVLTW